MDDTMCQWGGPAARLRVTGGDAATFLQGQFSNELRRPEPRPATYGLWLNHKGRALADSLVLQVGADVFELISRTSPAALIQERLEAYIIADDVVVEDLTSSCSGVVIAGARADDVLQRLGFAVPARGTFGVAGELIAMPARCGGPCWLVVAPSASTPALRAALEETGVSAVSREVLDRRRIAAGIPQVPDELGPDDLPNEGGLDHDAISFTKGCYLGQEVMARLHNLGQVRRRLFVVRWAEPGPKPEKGAPLFAGSQRVGDMRAAVSASTAGGDDAFGLAMVAAHAVQPGALLGLEPDGSARVEVLRLAEGRDR